MGNRINKIRKDLGIGLPTIVACLSKNGIQADGYNENTRLSDEEEDLVYAAHGNGKQPVRLSSLPQAPAQQPEEPVVSEVKPQPAAPSAPAKPALKIKGKIDLGTASEETPAPQAVAEPEPKSKPEPKPAVVPEKAPEPKPAVVVPEVVVEEKVEEKIEVKIEEKVEEVKAVEEKPAVKAEEIQPEVTPTTKNEPKPETKSEGGLTVVGHIDLSSINDRERPKKKTRAEKEKERKEAEEAKRKANKERRDKLRNQNKPAEKTGQSTNSSGDNSEKRPRQRIGGRKPIDITKVNVESASKDKKPSDGYKDKKKDGDGGRHKNDRRKSDDTKKGAFEDNLTSYSAVGRAFGRKKKKEKKEKYAAAEALEQLAAGSILKITEFVTVSELATMMGVSVNQVIGALMKLGMMVSINQRLDAEAINIVAEEFGFETQYVGAEVTQAIEEEEDNPEDMVTRPPIVTVMGHVDHGKTSLLDYIRNTNVIAGEAGGITQHIGAYNVKLEDGRRITFLDTPGHKAFTAMRARGAKATDVVIIVVAADDDVMPQTKEAISHASAAGVPIVFAINKIDKPNANPDKIKEALGNMNYLVEEWGGKYQSQDISAKKGIGVSELLEKVLLEAELLDLKANPNRKATGSVIESTLDKGRGYVATVLVSTGTLKIGDVVLAGMNYGRVKAMFNERGVAKQEAGPSVPVSILGLNGAPQAGDTFHVMNSDQEAREIATRREQLQREQALRTHKTLSLDELGRRIALGDFKELNLIVKGDVDGSIEAICDSLLKLSTEHIQVNIIHKAVGQISESDVSLAAASDAILIGFNVRPSAAARKQAEQDGVDIRIYSIIYDAIEEVKAAMEGMLAPEVKEHVTATVEVREVFHISKVGYVAGSLVRDGKVKRSDKARLIRDGIVIYTGAINALKRFKDDVKEVLANFECGVSLTNCTDIQVGDIIETYEEIEIKQTL